MAPWQRTIRVCGFREPCGRTGHPAREAEGLASLGAEREEGSRSAGTGSGSEMRGPEDEPAGENVLRSSRQTSNAPEEKGWGRVCLEPAPLQVLGRVWTGRQSSVCAHVQSPAGLAGVRGQRGWVGSREVWGPRNQGAGSLLQEALDQPPLRWPESTHKWTFPPSFSGEELRQTVPLTQTFK